MGYDWFVIHSKGWLTGSIRAQLTPAERGVWADLLALANESRIEGVVCMAKGIPYEREYLADILRIPVDLLNSTIDKCIKDENADDPRTRIMLDDAGCLIIANWEKYQPKARKGKDEEAKAQTKHHKTEAEIKAILRGYANKYPDVGLDVVFHDFGYQVVNKATGEIYDTIKQAIGGE